MPDFLQKLRLTNTYATQSLLPSAIFGSGSQLLQALTRPVVYKLAVFPCLSESETGAMMGVWTLLSYLLEQSEDVKVYRLFLKGVGDDVTQFTPDEWGDVDIQENGVLSGVMRVDAGEYVLTVQLENQLYDTQTSFEVRAKGLANFVSGLSAFANDNLLAKLDVIADLPKLSVSNSDGLEDFLEALADWEDLLAWHLWNDDWNDGDAAEIYERLMLHASQEVWRGWALAWAYSRLFAPAYQKVGEKLRQRIFELVESGLLSAEAMVLLARVMYRFAHTDLAQDALRAYWELNPSNVLVATSLASFYFLSARVLQAINVHQTLFNRQAEMHAEHWHEYGRLVLATYSYNLSFVNALVPNGTAIDEAEEAYRRAIKLENRAEDWFALLAMLWREDESLEEDDVEQLAHADKSGEWIKQLADLALESPEALETIVTAVEKAFEAQESQSAGQNVALAYAYSLMGEYDATIELLDELESAELEPDLFREVTRLRLEAEFEDLSLTLSQIEQVIEAGNRVNQESLNFLEEIIEVSPKFFEAHVLLAKAHLSRKDTNATLTALQEALAHFGDDEELVLLRDSVLTEQGKFEEAIEALEQALQAHPASVSLLARLARHLFESEPESSKLYLRRAESLNSKHPELSATRFYIAERIAKGGS